jgi:CheY-like chemotaxis protein/anti-sigma regulatory factor (Ser/Thr protein kinase)
MSRYVLADRQRLLQVLLNLLTNAVKYNRPGGAVEVACRPAANDCFAIEVRDTGPGIAAEDVGRLFVPFDRLGLEAGTREGAGLGLALAKRLVEAMNGSISVASVPGTGTTFTVVLPQAADPLADSEEAAAPPPTKVRRRATVLYIEDNRANLTLVERALTKRTELEVLSATTGLDGIELARKHRPDLLLLDLHLPDLGGEDVLDELAAHDETRDVPVVVISAAASKERIAALKRRGIAAYLTKPIDLARLLHVVDTALCESR